MKGKKPRSNTNIQFADRNRNEKRNKRSRVDIGRGGEGERDDFNAVSVAREMNRMPSSGETKPKKLC